MKFVLVASIALLATAQSFACSQMPTLFEQSTNLTRVMESKSFKAALQKQVEADNWVAISSINMLESITVVLTNGCEIESSLRFSPPPAPGLCAQFKGVVSKTICK
jgi:hypothetical protein